MTNASTPDRIRNRDWSEMNRKLWKPLAAIAALVAVVPVHAQMRNRGGGMPPDAHPGWDRGSLQQPMDTSRESPRQENPAAPGRMSPEERRRLRRDIHEAGREIYRPEHRPGP